MMRRRVFYFNADGKEDGWGDYGLFAKLQDAPVLDPSDFNCLIDAGSRGSENTCIYPQDLQVIRRHCCRYLLPVDEARVDALGRHLIPCAWSGSASRNRSEFLASISTFMRSPPVP